MPLGHRKVASSERRPAAKSAVALLAAAFCFSAGGLPDTSQDAHADTQQRPSRSGAGGISWEKCEKNTSQVDIRCAALSVPADWKRPNGKRTTLGIAKLPARKPEQRIGSIVVNTGGPAPMIPPWLSGTGTQDRLQELTTWFDVIAFDPRGLGTSNGVGCPPAPKYVNVMLSPDRQTWQEFSHANRQWEGACLNEAGPLAGNLDSWQVAHDIEAIRKALDEGKLTYFGNSYGTVYGQAYAELFPSEVGRMYLDSAFDHSRRSAAELARPRAEMINDKFREFGQWCETDIECALNPENARDVWDELLAQARREPLPAPGAGNDKTVGPGMLRFATLGQVADRSKWPRFAEALSKAREGDASGFYVTADDLSPRTSSEYLSWCSDFPFRKGWSAMASMERELRETAPRVGWLQARMTYSRCAGMTQQGTFPPHRIEPEGLPPVLLVSGLRDQTTPPLDGRRVADQLPGSVRVRADSDHAVYLGDNRCVRDIVHRYLGTGRLPEPDRSCPANDPEN